MKTRLPLSRYLLLLLVLAWSPVVSAQQAQQQQAQRAVNYGFVSPNTRENLKLEEAIKGMNSLEQAKLLSNAVNLGCVVRSRIRAYRALGSWNDGAEYSVMLRVDSDLDTLRYVVSRMGRDAEQKYVIYFHPEPTGSADLYRLWIPRRTGKLAPLTTTLEQAGIPFRTLVPSTQGTSVYIIDLDRDLREKILTVSRKLGARVSFQPGNATLFGNDTRPQAKVVFEEEIKKYETKNPDLPPACDAKRKNGH
jgi:hypothetical protein